MNSKLQKLNNIIANFDTLDYNMYNYEYNEREETIAYLLLSCFYDEFVKIKPHRKVSKEMYCQYITLLLFIDEAFRKKRYTYVCNHISSLNHYTDITQERIYYNLLSLFRKYNI